MNIIHFGAGNIGKGLIGYILSLNRCNICFVDVNDQTVQQLNEQKQYLIQILDKEPKILTVNHVSALPCRLDSNSLIEKSLNADLITTSVGVNNLVKIAPILVQLIEFRVKIKKHIDIIANENAINASTLLANEIKKLVGHEHYKILTQYCSFVNSAIDRQSLTVIYDGSPITAVEPFFEWIINSSELVNQKLLQMQSIKFVPELQPYIEKKLYIVNLGHCATAYLGALAKKVTVQETLQVPAFVNFIRNTMQQSASYIIKQYQFPNQDITDYIEKTLERFSNPNLQDAVLRVGRSPIRKLGNNERIIGPLQALYTQQLPYSNLIKIAALALAFEHIDDEDTQVIQTIIGKYGVKYAINELTKLNQEPLIEQISAQYLKLKHELKTAESDSDLENRLISFVTDQG